ncbi:MAG: hypothetical protein LC749_18225, partial [Actinobacteria bacterium]|nr:hypothetical protein [Actinomycetota bacterium]
MKPQSTGQVVEWLVWSTLVAQSQGELHIFLPTHDLGVDAVVRRPVADRAVAVQVKGRTDLNEGVYRIHVQADEAGPGVVLVAVLAEVAALRLDARVLLVPMSEVAARAPLLRWGRRMAYSVELPWPPGRASHWHEFAVPLEELGERLC